MEASLHGLYDLSSNNWDDALPLEVRTFFGTKWPRSWRGTASAVPWKVNHDLLQPARFLGPWLSPQADEGSHGILFTTSIRSQRWQCIRG